MSSKSDPKSDKASESPDASSVFDFLYADTARIASFLSQFDQYGHLVEYVAARQETEGQTETGQIGASIGVPKALGVHKDKTSSVQSSANESDQRKYDPKWINALNFLEHLAVKDLFERDVEGAQIGQFVLITGKLQILNFASISKLWSSGAVEGLVRAAMPPMGQPKSRQQARAQGRKGASEPDQVNLLLDLYQAWPHLAQGMLKSNVDTWFTLNEGGLSTSSSDLMLKHGISLDGEWSMLGVLDAMPASSYSEDDADLVADGAIVANLLRHLIPIARQSFGRPAHTYGVTPLVIFREIGGR